MIFIYEGVLELVRHSVQFVMAWIQMWRIYFYRLIDYIDQLVVTRVFFEFG